MKVSVLLPVRNGAGSLDRAIACVRDQTLRPAEIVVVLNEPDAATRAAVAEVAKACALVRVVEAPRTNLAGALNVGLRECGHELVARMDADDSCAKGRMERQAGYLNENPGILAVGCAWEQVRGGQVVHVMQPPTEPGALRARLLLENCLAHGSVMLRRAGVLAEGGYDLAMERAQDYDLWLRLSRGRRVGAVSEVLYTYTLRETGGAYSGDDVQAGAAARLLVREWSMLARASADERAALERGMTSVMRGDSRGGRGAVDAVGSASPSVEALLAAVWARWRVG